VNTGVTGDFIRVNNSAGAEATTTLSLTEGGSAVWEAQGEYADAQLTTFIHGNIVKEYVRGFSDLEYLDQLLPANVNVNDSCNAFYNGDSINFFRSASGCGNTGRIADVVYHEFGHAIHDNSIIAGVGAFDGAASEGLSDFLAATITGDPAMGRGFFGSDAPLRHVDPANAEHVWPDDIGEIHYTGLIIAGALWDMRKALVADLGEMEGVAVANRIFYQAMRRAVDIPTMYFEALAADDDDGDLSNGTPHICQINAGFTVHGLREITAIGSKLSVAPPHQDGYVLSLALTGLFHECPSDETNAAEVEWRLRGQPEVGGLLAMSLGPTGFEAMIPTQPDGSIVEYRVSVAFEDGEEETYPKNPADPYYELFVGHVEPLYCTDFETDPFAEGWTHGLSGGEPGEGADDWQWGQTQSPPESADPSRPYSGDSVLGNDLGADSFNGDYQTDKINYAESPVIDTTGYEVVRLQYRRWLTVEDHRFDTATIYADGEPVWANAESNDGDIDHVDSEWRFSDVDLSAQAADGNVVLRYELSSDGGMNLGGWTVDDFCVVGYVPTVCGDGLVTGLEPCDDGASNSDTDADACRTDCVVAACGDGVLDSEEECDDANLDGDDGCDAECLGTGDGQGPGGGLPPGADDAGALEGLACGCHTVGAPERSWSYAWLSMLALGLAGRRRFRS
jgi:MYXO-CTERM domain-containing protein